MQTLHVLSSAVCFSVLVALSSSINKSVQIDAFEMSVRRFAAVGGLCIFLMAAFPTWVCSKKQGPPYRTQLMSMVSGLVFFMASMIYIMMTRRYGVVQTSISTTSTSFIAITIAGVLMSETIVAADIAAMVAISLVTVGWRLFK